MGKKRVIKKSEEELVQEGKGSQPSVASKPTVERPAERIKAGRVFIYSSYNNTLMTLTDEHGNILANVSAGAIGFKGTKKSTPFAASKVADTLAQIAKNKGLERMEVKIKGVGAGRDSALRSIGTKGIEVTSIQDITPIPHNGPRPRKVRRV